MSVIHITTALVLATLLLSLPSVGDTVRCSDPSFGLSPYTWKMMGTGTEARVEAMLPGAYLKTVAKSTTTIGLVIDGAANKGCPQTSMPWVEYSVDEAPFTKTQLTQSGEVYTLPIASGLDAAAPHKLEVYLRAAGLMASRWTSSMAHLRIAGLELDKGGSLATYPKRAKLAMGFGDSITEGVGVDAKFTSWDNLEQNNARCSWFPIVCSALGCEYGQLGSSGQGMIREMELPGLGKTWDRYDPETSRLTNGLLIPEPDYVFCNMGTNDYKGGSVWEPIDIVEPYTAWIKAVRSACPHAWIFCVLPPSGVHREAINAAVKRSGSPRTYVIDVASLNTEITVKGTPTQMTYDGVHPNLYGDAMLAAGIVAQVQDNLSKSRISLD